MTNDKKSAFSNFIDSKSAPEKQINWNSKKQLWLQKIDDLYSDIGSWLSDYIKKGQVTLSKESENLTEEYIGTYQVPILNIKIGSSELIKLNPVGTLIIGGNGRIDATGKSGKVMFILSHKDYRPGVTVNVFTSEAEKLEYEKKQEEERKNKPELNRGNLIWLYARRAPTLEYFPLTKDLFEEILMSISGK